MNDRRGPLLCLASASPRRRELLDQIGIPHTQIATGVDESAVADSDPRSRIRAVADLKARAGLRAIAAHGAGHLPVLAADTAVVLDGAEMGKPVDRLDAERMLSSLSGRQHWVYTAVVLQTPESRLEQIGATRVWFRPLRPGEIARYCDSEEPFDKAGAYAIQGRAAVFVSHIEGSYSNVVGLPLFETAGLLARIGIYP